MKINKSKAKGIVVCGERFEYAVTERLPQVHTEILREMRFVGKVRDLRKLFGARYSVE